MTFLGRKAFTSTADAHSVTAAQFTLWITARAVVRFSAALARRSFPRLLTVADATVTFSSFGSSTDFFVITTVARIVVTLAVFAPDAVTRDVGLITFAVAAEAVATLGARNLGVICSAITPIIILLHVVVVAFALSAKSTFLAATDATLIGSQALTFGAVGLSFL